MKSLKIGNEHTCSKASENHENFTLTAVRQNPLSIQNTGYMGIWLWFCESLYILSIKLGLL